MTDATLARPITSADSNREHVLADAERLVRAAELSGGDTAAPYFSDADLPYWVNPSIWEAPSALALALVRPRAIMRAVEGTEWRAALAIVGSATLLRTVTFTAYGIGSDLTNNDIVVGTATSLAGPFLFVGAVTGLLTAISAGMRKARPLQALSLAALSAAPIVVRELLQAVATPILDHALRPVGIVGLLAPNAPQWLLYTLAPLDAFGIWSLVLVVMAVWVTVTSARSAAPVAADSPTQSAY